MHLVLPTAPVRGRVVSSTICTASKSQSIVRHVCIDVSGTPLEGNFHAGQSFGVIPPGTDENGRPHKVRLYSIASPGYGEDGAGRILSTTVKRLIAERHDDAGATDAPAPHPLFLGVCSNYLCDLLPGDSVDVTGPAGKRFVLPADRNAHDYLFLATGTGIAPFRGMLHELLVGPPDGSPARAAWRPCGSRITLVMGSPYSTDLLYDRWLRDLASAHPNFSYRTAISREPGEAARGRYVHDHLRLHLAEYTDALESPRTLAYLCGLSGMQIGFFKLLATSGHGHYFMTVQEPLASTPPASWSDADIKRRIHATRRCMLEVY